MLKRRIRVNAALGAVLGLLALGTVGYRVIEGWPWFDCFYMTVITVATIGYGEPGGITVAGRLFTVFIIFAGVGVVGYAITVFTQWIIQIELGSMLGSRRIQNAMKKISDHFIICGAGRIGLRVARELTASNVPFVIVERDEALAERLARDNMIVLSGDATAEEVLTEAAIDRAKGLLCALPSDAENVYVALTARGLSPNLYIVARANDESAISKVRKAGANRIISPIVSGAHHIAQALLRPTVADFIDLATKTEGLDLVIEETRLAPESVLVGKSLQESNIRADLNIIVIVIFRESGETLFNPKGDIVFEEDDTVIAIGGKSSVEELARVAMSGRRAAR
jgi:voltage-gated potassium channel